MIADSERIRHDRQRRIDRGARRKEAPVNDVEIVEVVRLAVCIERRRLRVLTEPNSAILMRNARKWYPLSEKEVAGEQANVT